MEPEDDYLNRTWFMLTDEGWILVDESDMSGNTYGYEPEQGPDISVSEKSKAAEEKAIEIVSQIIRADMSEYEKVLAIHDYLCLNVEYDYDNYLNGTIPHESYTAEGALIYGRAVFNGYTDAFTYLCYEAGIEVERVQGLADNGTVNGAHAWNQVKIDGEWFNIDVTWDDLIGMNDIDYYRYDYFLITDEQIEKNHTPQTYSEQHSCTSVRYKDEIKKLKVSRNLRDYYTYVSLDEEAIRAVERYMEQGVYSYQIVYDVENIDEERRSEIMNYLLEQIEEYRREKYPNIRYTYTVEHGEDYLIFNVLTIE